MCKINGKIIYISSANNFCVHGFYQFSPNLFGSFYGKSQDFRDTNINLCKMYDSSVWYKIKRENINNPKTIQQSDYRDNFYKQKKLKTIQESKKEKSLLKKKLKKFFHKFDLIKKIYNLFRMNFEYKYNKIVKFYV